MSYKLLLFIIIQVFPLVIWVYLLQRKDIKVDWRLLLSYFIFGSWFGMMAELFLYKLVEWVFHMPIWEYRILPVHNGITSSLGPIMWGLTAVYVCLHHNYKLTPLKTKNPIKIFLLESGFLLVLELVFNFIAFFIFNDYFFYYFVPDLWHWSSFTNMPFWWLGYKIMIKYSSVLYKEEKLNLTIAVIIMVVLFAYQ